MKVFRAHPAAELFPMLGASELVELTADIVANGQRDPIDIVDGEGEWLILDGRNRMSACCAAGVEPVTRVLSGVDPIAYVLSKNLHRRHLDESQRAMVVSKVARLSHGGDRSKPPIGGLKQTTQAEAAAMLNVSERSVQRARVVLENAPAQVVAAVEAGRVSVADAASVARMAPEKQIAALEKVTTGTARTMRAAADDAEDPPDDELEVYEVEDEPSTPIKRQPELIARWGEFELKQGLVAVIADSRDYLAKVERHFAKVDPAFRDEFAQRAESALLEVFEGLRSRLPVTARRAEENRSRMRVLEGGK